MRLHFCDRKSKIVLFVKDYRYAMQAVSAMYCNQNGGNFNG